MVGYSGLCRRAISAPSRFTIETAARLEHPRSEARSTLIPTGTEGSRPLTRAVFAPLAREFELWGTIEQE
jgi:hypothetical protein